MSTDKHTNYADSPQSTVRESRRIVRQTLETHAVGRENATPGTELVELVPLKYTTVRDIISELRDDEQGPPIGNCGDGYFIINSDDELDDWVEKKRDELQTIKDRMTANVKAYNRRKYE